MKLFDKVLSATGFTRTRHKLGTEIVAGLTTFLAMAYILVLNPKMFAPLESTGFPVDSVFTSTALAAIVGTLLMAFLAKRPLAQAPGLTLNVFFVQTVCVSMGYSWQFALTAVLIEGLLFIAICLTGMRQMIFEMLPPSIKYSISVGIGLFIAQIGLTNSGLLMQGNTLFGHIDTLMKPESLLFILGLVLAGFFTLIHLRGGLLLSILITTLVGIPMGVSQIPMEGHLFSMPPSPEPLLFKFSWSDVLTPDMLVCVLTMLFFDVFDTLGTTVGVMANAGLIRPNGRIPNLTRIMLSDAIATSAGACLGCSTVTTYVESASGVAEGGRTGMTALVVALCFTASLFLSPLYLATPAAATAPIMVIAGFYLFSSIRYINVKDPVECIPAFLIILLMPVTGSISDGILVGMASYAVLSSIDRLISRHRGIDDEEDIQ